MVVATDSTIARSDSSRRSSIGEAAYGGDARSSQNAEPPIRRDASDHLSVLKDKFWALLIEANACDQLKLKLNDQTHSVSRAQSALHKKQKI